VQKVVLAREFSGEPAVLIAAFVSWGAAVATFVYFIVYQQVENYLIAPRVMKKAVDLSPAAVIVSVLVGGSLAGFAGALLALPIAAAAKVVITGGVAAQPPRRERCARPGARAAAAGSRCCTSCGGSGLTADCEVSARGTARGR